MQREMGQIDSDIAEAFALFWLLRRRGSFALTEANLFNFLTQYTACFILFYFVLHVWTSVSGLVSAFALWRA